MKNFTITMFILSLVFFIGCSKEPVGSQNKDKNYFSKEKNLINRAFEDLTLGMTFDEFTSKVVYVDEGLPKPSSGKIYKRYTVYSGMFNVNFTWMVKNPQLGKIKEIENIYEVYCDFFENRLFWLTIIYRNSYHPSWDSFVYNAKQKYGEGIESLDTIEWNDGKTTLIISRGMGEQFQPPSYRITDYGEYYRVSYIDNKLFSEMDKKEKEKTPKF